MVPELCSQQDRAANGTRAVPVSREAIRIYTDGACRGNPGPGGWGALLIYRGREKELSGSEEHTTNNRMELTAAIRALEEIKRKHPIQLITDSRYLLDGIQLWLPRWSRNQWRTSGRKPVKNKDLWQRLHELSAGLDIDWRWVEGHSGEAGNERADALANAGIDRLTACRHQGESVEGT